MMRILIVCSYRSHLETGIAPFISEQVEALHNQGVELDYFLVQGKGLRGYLKHLMGLNAKISAFKPDIVHAHYGLCGLLANIQRRVPVVTTYHGSDVNDVQGWRFSRWSVKLSRWNIFVSKPLALKAQVKTNYSVIPCGIDDSLFYPRDKNLCRQLLGWEPGKRYVLFSKSFDVAVKNYPLAKAAVDQIEDAELVELKGYSREEVALLMNGCDVALMTSFSEGSPQFIKEAIACGTPIVSTDVGDVKDVIEEIENCLLCSYEIEDVISKINLLLFENPKVVSVKYLEQFNQQHIAKEIVAIYSEIIKNGKSKKIS